MPFDLSSIVAEHKPLPPRLVVYGQHGIGKTTFACAAPNPIVIRTEDGLGTLQVPAFPLATDYMHIVEALRALYKESHTYRTVVIDSLDWLEPLVWHWTAREGGKQTIEDFGYGKGYVLAEEHWSRILDGLNHLRAKGMTVILLAHSEIKRFDSPETEPYDRYQIKLHKVAAALMQEWADIVGFAHQEVFTQKTDVGFNKKIVRGTGDGSRVLALQERPAYYAKNRYALPEQVPLEWAKFADTLRAAYRTTAALSTESPTPEVANG